MGDGGWRTFCKKFMRIEFTFSVMSRLMRDGVLKADSGEGLVPSGVWKPDTTSSLPVDRDIMH